MNAGGNTPLNKVVSQQRMGLIPEALKLRFDFVGNGGAVLVSFQVVKEGYKLLWRGGRGGSGVEMEVEVVVMAPSLAL
jgi:hypothetical protein